MKKLFFSFSLILLGCTKDKSPFILNLILNSSFEVNGTPSYQGWVGDTALMSFSNDVPPNGGNWSLQLVPGSTQGTTAFVGNAEARVTGIAGTNSFILKAWMKNSAPEHRGSMALGVSEQNHMWDSPLVQEKVLFGDTITYWKQYILTHTLTTVSSDTIIVRLSAGTVGPFGLYRYVLFDMVELKMDED